MDLAALARLAARRWGEDFGILTVLSALRSSTGRGLGIRIRVGKLWGGKELVFWGIGERKRSVRFAGTLEVKGTSRLSPVSPSQRRRPVAQQRRVCGTLLPRSARAVLQRRNTKFRNAFDLQDALRGRLPKENTSERCGHCLICCTRCAFFNRFVERLNIRSFLAVCCWIRYDSQLTAGMVENGMVKAITFKRGFEGDALIRKLLWMRNDLAQCRRDRLRIRPCGRCALLTERRHCKRGNQPQSEQANLTNRVHLQLPPFWHQIRTDFCAESSIAFCLSASLIPGAQIPHREATPMPSAV